MTNVTCPVCLTTNSPKAWEAATETKYDMIAPLDDPMRDDCYYVCPCCRKESVGYMLGFDSVVMA